MHCYSYSPEITADFIALGLSFSFGGPSTFKNAKKAQDCVQRIPAPLLLWYQKEKRELPWRKDPTAYHVWVSEIMLQQTRVEAVKEYYLRFMAALPTMQDLAECPEEKLLKLWEGLGYYN